MGNGVSNSIGNQINRFKLAVEGAKTHSNDLPKEVATLAATLATNAAAIEALNAKQEDLKQQLAATTAKLQAALKESQGQRTRIVRFAEATFGPTDKRLKSFRPAAEGKIASKRKVG
ncbi:MAG: hypothetical protein QM765_50610 [Myxococcales bacterium]